MSEVKLTGLAAVLAAVGLGADSRDSVSREVLNNAITAAMAEGEKAGVLKAGNDATKITADAIKAANVRAQAILNHADAKGREDLASHLAFDTEMSSESAIAMLCKAPKGAPASRLGSVPDPKVGTEETQQPDAGASLVASMDRMITSRGLKPVA
jgi:vacuolar-type H+-ATPase subunit H